MVERVAEMAPAVFHKFCSGRPPAALVLQLMAGCHSITGCMFLAGALEEPSATAAFKIGAACSLVFAPGEALVDGLLTCAKHGDVAASSEAGLALCEEQLQAVNTVVAKLLSLQPTAAAAAANATGTPAALLPWLQALSQAFLHGGAATGARTCK